MWYPGSAMLTLRVRSLSNMLGILSFDEWRQSEEGKDPKLSYYGQSLDGYVGDRCDTVVTLNLHSGCNTHLNPDDALKFANAIIAYVKEAKPDYVKFGQYEHSLEMFAPKPKTSELITEYMRSQYARYVHRCMDKAAAKLLGSD